MKIYVLIQTYIEDVNIIGIYKNKETAEKKIPEYINKFSDADVVEYELNED